MILVLQAIWPLFLPDNIQHTSLPTHLGSTPLGNRSIKHGDISLVPSGIFVLFSAVEYRQRVLKSFFSSLIFPAFAHFS